MSNRKATEQLLSGIRQAQGAIDEQEPERAAMIMRGVLGEMASAGVASAHAHWVAAVACDLSQEVEMAFKEAQKAIELDPLALPFRHSFTVIVNHLRAILGDTDRPENEEATPRLYALLVRCGKADVGAHLAMARYYLTTGEVAEANRLVEAVVRLFPAEGSAWRMKARVARAIGDEAGAAEADAEAMVVAPEDPPFGINTVAEA